MTAYYWPQFWRDVRHAVAALKKQGLPQTAARYFDAVETLIELVVQNPQRGHPRPDLRPDGIRAVSVRGFRRSLIYYRQRPDAVEFIALRRSGLVPGHRFRSDAPGFKRTET